MNTQRTIIFNLIFGLFPGLFLYQSIYGFTHDSVTIAYPSMVSSVTYLGIESKMISLFLLLLWVIAVLVLSGNLSIKDLKKVSINDFRNLNKKNIIIPIIISILYFPVIYFLGVNR